MQAVAAFQRVVRIRLIEKVIFVQRLEGSELCSSFRERTSQQREEPMWRPGGRSEPGAEDWSEQGGWEAMRLEGVLEGGWHTAGPRVGLLRSYSRTPARSPVPRFPWVGLRSQFSSG